MLTSWLVINCLVHKRKRARVRIFVILSSCAPVSHIECTDPLAHALARRTCSILVLWGRTPWAATHATRRRLSV